MHCSKKFDNFTDSNKLIAILFQPSTAEDDSKTKFLFVYQSNWMKRLLLLYGQEMCLMDATYRTCRCSIHQDQIMSL